MESEDQIADIAREVKGAGAASPRRRFQTPHFPYAFQGLRAEGLELLRHAQAKTGLPIVTEIMSPAHLILFEDVDIIQVGARNMQNFELLKELGKCDKPILLKRGLANTIEELLMSAEYIMASGNDRVILCERGIRTFETMTRNTLDISAVPILKKAVPPAGGGGSVPRLRPQLAGGAAGHGRGGGWGRRPDHRGAQRSAPRPCPDGAQSVTPDEFRRIASPRGGGGGRLR